MLFNAAYEQIYFNIVSIRLNAASLWEMGYGYGKHQNPLHVIKNALYGEGYACIIKYVDATNVYWKTHILT